MSKRAVVWEDRKRNFLGLPWTFTKYSLTNDRLYINTGFLNSREDEVRLFRIMDMTLTRSLWQKLIGTGTIHCVSVDQTMKNFDIVNVKSPADVKEKLSVMVDKCRRENYVYTRENMSTGHGPVPDLHHHAGNGSPGDMPDMPDMPDMADLQDYHGL